MLINFLWGAFSKQKYFTISQLRYKRPLSFKILDVGTNDIERMFLQLAFDRYF